MYLNSCRWFFIFFIICLLGSNFVNPRVFALTVHTTPVSGYECLQEEDYIFSSCRNYLYKVGILPESKIEITVLKRRNDGSWQTVYDHQGKSVSAANVLFAAQNDDGARFTVVRRPEDMSKITTFISKLEMPPGADPALSGSLRCMISEDLSNISDLCFNE